MRRVSRQIPLLHVRPGFLRCCRWRSHGRESPRWGIKNVAEMMPDCCGGAGVAEAVDVQDRGIVSGRCGSPSFPVQDHQPRRGEVRPVQIAMCGCPGWWSGTDRCPEVGGHGLIKVCLAHRDAGSRHRGDRGQRVGQLRVAAWISMLMVSGPLSNPFQVATPYAQMIPAAQARSSAVNAQEPLGHSFGPTPVLRVMDEHHARRGPEDPSTAGSLPADVTRFRAIPRRAPTARPPSRRSSTFTCTCSRARLVARFR